MDFILQVYKMHTTRNFSSWHKRNIIERLDIFNVLPTNLTNRTTLDGCPQNSMDHIIFWGNQPIYILPYDPQHHDFKGCDMSQIRTCSQKQEFSSFLDNNLKNIIKVMINNNRSTTILFFFVLRHLHIPYIDLKNKINVFTFTPIEQHYIGLYTYK